MRYRLRTLLILLAILPPLLAVGWRRYSQWREEQERQRALQAQQIQIFSLFVKAVAQDAASVYMRLPPESLSVKTSATVEGGGTLNEPAPEQ